MSLVNNMLRDLDRRRKDSDSSGSAVRLMPAGELTAANSKNFLPIVLAAVVLAAVAVVYFWSQVGQTNVDQRLDLQAQPPLSDSRRVVEELQESIATAEARETVLQRENEASRQQPSQLTTQAESQASQVRNEPAQQNFLRDSSARGEVATTAISSAPVVSNPLDSSPFTEIDAAVSEPAVSMKEAPQYSTEQLDTMAVQDALRLIADGQAEAAFTTLESYIIENRNAHQSRETYAKLLMSRGRIADASALINVGLGLAPNHTGFKKVKARLLMIEGDISSAVTTLISRAPDIVDDSEYHDLLASAQLSSRDFAGAIISYRGLVEHDQTQGKWWYGYAAANDQLGNASVARQAYVKAMQLSNLSANLRQRSQERIVALNR